MIIEQWSFPNPDFGYETTIRMPFHFSKLGNGKISAYDEALYGDYDTFTCKCSCVMSGYKWEDMTALVKGKLSTETRGSAVRLNPEAGFYPFTPALVSTAATPGRFLVRLNKVERKGAVDLQGRMFQVDFEILLEQEPVTRIIGPFTQVPEGELAIVGTPYNGTETMVEGIRFPPGGFAPSLAHNVYLKRTASGRIEVVNHANPAFDMDSNNPKIVTNQNTAANIVAQLLALRTSPFRLSVGRNYSPFGDYQWQPVEYDVRLSTNEIKIRHTRFDEFEINFSTVRL